MTSTLTIHGDWTSNGTVIDDVEAAFDAVHRALRDITARGGYRLCLCADELPPGSPYGGGIYQVRPYGSRDRVLPAAGLGYVEVTERGYRIEHYPDLPAESLSGAYLAADTPPAAVAEWIATYLPCDCQIARSYVDDEDDD